MPFSMELTLGWHCLSYAAWTLWFLGYPDQALKRSQEALTLAQECLTPLALAFALDYAADVPSIPPGGASSPRAGRGSRLTLSTEQGFPYFLAWGTYAAGLGAGRAGTGRRRDCADTPGSGRLPGHRSRDSGGRIILLCWPRRMGKWDRPKKGLAVLAEALALVDKTGERCYEAELYRLKGELTLAQSQASRQSEQS